MFLAFNLAYLAYLAYLATATQMKLKRTIRYHHLTRDFVDEASYPPTQEYILYSHKVCQLPRSTCSTTTTVGQPATQDYILYSHKVSPLPMITSSTHTR